MQLGMPAPPALQTLGMPAPQRSAAAGQTGTVGTAAAITGCHAAAASSSRGCLMGGGGSATPPPLATDRRERLTTSQNNNRLLPNGPGLAFRTPPPCLPPSGSSSLRPSPGCTCSWGKLGRLAPAATVHSGHAFRRGCGACITGCICELQWSGLEWHVCHNTPACWQWRAMHPDEVAGWQAVAAL
jgi:hypothetical protein